MKIRQVLLILATVTTLNGCAVHGHGHRAHGSKVIVAPQPKVVVRVAPVVHCGHRHHHRC